MWIGLWVSDDTESPILTTIGSSNFNARSLDRDLELQSFLVTDCPELSQRIKEVSGIYVLFFGSRTNPTLTMAEPGVHF